MSKNPVICPMCEAGTLTPITYSDQFLLKGGELAVDGLEGYECPNCGADPILKDQIRRNHLRIMDARRRADGLLTGSEIRTIRHSLKLSQQEASDLFGGGVNAFSKYERGDVVQSVAMDRLLRLVAQHPELMPELAGSEIRPMAFAEAIAEAPAASLQAMDWISPVGKEDLCDSGRDPIL